VDSETNSTVPVERQLREQLQCAETELAARKDVLRQVRAEWNALEEKRAQYEPLEHACQSIEKLAEAGLARIFWGDRASDDDVTSHLADVRARVADVAREITDVERRRDAAQQLVEQQLDAIDVIENELLQAIEADERRKQEWAIEREENELPWREQVMPWTRSQEDDRRFQKTLLASALVSILLGLLIPYIDIPLPSRDEAIEVPERLASLIRNEPRPMPKPQPVHEEKIKPKPQEQQPEPEPEVKPEPATQVAQQPSPESKAQAAKKRAATAGLLAFRESFSNLAKSRPSARLGSAARINNSGESAVGLPQRNMVATSGPGSSGGINLSSLSRDVGDGGAGGQIEGVQLSRVANSIGGTGGGDRPLANGGVAGRTDEEIQIVFDRHKAQLYRMYNRELRKDPTLRGQMVLRLTILPDGSVSACSLVSATIQAPLLADEVVQRILGFDFGAKDVPAITIVYPIDFLPTA
jgi:hypothetical protein